MSNHVLRIIIDILLLVSVLYSWWVGTLIIALVGMWRFSPYGEVVIAGIMYDALFGMSPHLGMWGYAGTIVGVGILTLGAIGTRVVRR